MNYPDNPPPYSGPAPGVQVVQLQPLAGPQVATTTVVVSQNALSTEPTLMVCHSCRYQILTKLDVRPTAQTHLWAVCLLLFGCWPCVWIPYCTPSCMSVEHYCPNCNAYIGKY